MNVSAINSSSAAANLASMQMMRDDSSAAGVNTSPSTKNGRDPAAIKKAAQSFEAIILRQLLSPTIEPIMSGGMGGKPGPGAGGGSVYGFMLTDALANSMSKGGGFGLARMLEKQLTPHAARADIKDSARDIAHQKT